MRWSQITVDVPDELEDAIVGEFADRVAGIWESARPASGITRLVLYFDSNSDIDEVETRIRRVFEQNGCSEPAILKGTLEDRDWAEDWKKTYKSFPVGDSFYVIPSWEDSKCPRDRIALRIDPGQAFGTGTHETTQLTLEALERWIDEDRVVLDLGTGSGILAIAARRLGARKVFACDIDPDAVRVASANVRRNTKDQVRTFVGSVDTVGDERVNLVLGNLTAGLILSLFAEIDRILQPHGVAIFSGILHDQIEDVRELLDRFHYSVHEEWARGQWMTLVVEKHVD